MTREVVVPVVVALISAGLFPLVRDAAKWVLRVAHPERSREARAIHEHIASADQSVLVAAHARDELQQDIVSLREQLVEMEARHDRERQRWRQEKAEMRQEMDAMEVKIRSLLDEVIALRTRHALDKPQEG